MRLETTETSVKLVENYKERGQWAVHWDFKKKPNEEGMYWYLGRGIQLLFRQHWTPYTNLPKWS